MKRVPPVMVIVLLVMWLVLNSTLEVRQVAFGALLAAALLFAAAPLRPLHPRLRRGSVIVKLLVAVLIDIVRSNIGVGRVVLGLTGGREVHSGFMSVPLHLRDPHGLAALAMIITSTPGTVWVDLAPDGSLLTIHVLDLVDETEWVNRIKQRYERPLMEILE